MSKKSVDETVEEKFPKDKYPIRIGVYSDKSGKGTPLQFVDREAHRKFVENIMATSPYGQNYNR